MLTRRLAEQHGQHVVQLAAQAGIVLNKGLDDPTVCPVPSGGHAAAVDAAQSGFQRAQLRQHHGLQIGSVQRVQRAVGSGHLLGQQFFKVGTRYRRLAYQSRHPVDAAHQESQAAQPVVDIVLLQEGVDATARARALRVVQLGVVGEAGLAPSAHHGAQRIAAVGLAIDTESGGHLLGQPVADGVDAQATVWCEPGAVIYQHFVQRQILPAWQLAVGQDHARIAIAQPLDIFFGQAGDALNAVNASVALEDSIQVFADGLVLRNAEQRRQGVLHRIRRERAGIFVGLQRLRAGLDIYQLALRRHVSETLRQRLGHIAERLVVEVAAVSERPASHAQCRQAVEIRLPNRQLLWGDGRAQLAHPLQRHRFESEREGRGAARREGKERVIGLGEVEVTAGCLAVGILDLRGVAEVETLLVAAFIDHLVEQAQGHRGTADIRRCHVEVEFLDQRRRELAVAAARRRHHLAEGLQQLQVHAITGQQRGWRALRPFEPGGQALPGLAVVE